MKPCFLNVDLEIVSSSKLDALAAEMGRRVDVLYSGAASKRGNNMLVLESSRYLRNPDAVIHSLCSVIESLPPPARRIWQRASKQFDVGYELRPKELSSRFSLRPDTLKRVAALGATLTVTYYRGEPNEAKNRFSN